MMSTGKIPIEYGFFLVYSEGDAKTTFRYSNPPSGKLLSWVGGAGFVGSEALNPCIIYGYKN